MPRGVKTSRSVNRRPARELQFRDDDQRYGIVTKLLGNNRMMVKIIDYIEDTKTTDRFTECICTVRGSMRRREWVHVNNVVLVALRDFGDHHDIIARYTDEEVRVLERVGELCLQDAASSSDEQEIVFEDVDEI